jgi:hypothetical protein
MIHYLWWIPLVIIYYVGYAWLSVKNNESSTTLNWFMILYLYGGIIQIWVIVSRFSKNIFFDALLYDFVLITSQNVALIYFSNTKFSITQTIGVILATLGLLMIR